MTIRNHFIPNQITTDVIELNEQSWKKDSKVNKHIFPLDEGMWNGSFLEDYLQLLSQTLQNVPILSLSGSTSKNLF